MVKAIVYPLISNNVVIGRINFTQQALTSLVDIEVNISNILDGPHAFHINTYANISNGAATTVPIFFQLKDIEAKDGIVNVHQPYNADQISLFEGGRCIIGRAVVVYAGSLAVGSLGDPIAWGVIGLSNPN